MSFHFSELTDLAITRLRQWHHQCTSQLTLEPSRPRREHACPGRTAEMPDGLDEGAVGAWRGRRLFLGRDLDWRHPEPRRHPGCELDRAHDEHRRKRAHRPRVISRLLRDPKCSVSGYDA